MDFIAQIGGKRNLHDGGTFSLLSSKQGSVAPALSKWQ